MVMKLLLIALNLETDRTEDKDEQLAANRPLTSPFFVGPSTLMIAVGVMMMMMTANNQVAYRVMPTEDGSFIIKSTTPSRAQSTSAGLMHVLRVAFAAAMVHARKTNNPKLHLPVPFPTCTCTNQSSHPLHNSTGTWQPRSLTDKAQCPPTVCNVPIPYGMSTSTSAWTCSTP